MGKLKVNFVEGLGQISQGKRQEGAALLDITAGELHRYVGDYPAPPNGNHAMATASDVSKRGPPSSRAGRFSIPRQREKVQDCECSSDFSN